ncbi:hypothetical protein [Streptomyces sp. S1D4-14]|uniref:hypothetical protein n=1 Tax=Streptomyces sp. S1D4-14 TaxID=2594461 RepID=UPI0011642F87|nr:hypothetical protein [Streptomyces sp. S1D4-14]QDN64489.1 hypothetical protein FNV66_01250 [Streptomyces sp. S1D4-14]
MEYFKPGDAVWITYPGSITADRAADVVEDTGGAKVKVRWQTTRSTGRGRAVGNNDWREQRIARERLEPRSR